ncbi:MAG: hypothetical protein IPK16_16110 [Anaerolineales bacterium]|nr:hypothetical protein [Anaerolineales bacterium]
MAPLPAARIQNRLHSKPDTMRLLRILILALVLGVFYFALYLLWEGSLRTFFPGWLTAAVPLLHQTSYWLADDLRLLGGALLILAVLAFALLAPTWEEAPWPSQRPRSAAYPAPTPRGAPTRMSRGMLILAVGVVIAGAVGLALLLGVPESGWLDLAWFAGIALVVVGAVLLRRAGNAPRRVAERVRVGQWLPLALLLTASGILLAWGWGKLPIQIDGSVARTGLEARAMSTGAVTPLVAASATGAPRVALVPAALAMRLIPDPLAATQVIGWIAALATIAATWAIGELLFRRRGDGGQEARIKGLALLAAGFTAGTVAVLHFGRMAPFLPATAVGAWAAWATLYGLRMRHWVALVMGGVLAGAAGLLDRSGLMFPLILALWLAGLWFIERSLRSGAPNVRTGIMVWVAGLWAVLAPALGTWMAQPAAFTAYVRGTLLYSDAVQGSALITVWDNLRAGVLGLFWLPDASLAAAYPGSLLNIVVGPLFVLGFAALLLAVDRRLGWCLVSWILEVVVFSSLANELAPHWPTLLPLLPAAGLAAAFGANRIWAWWGAAYTVHSSESSAPALGIALVVAALGLSWVGYYQFSQSHYDAASAAARGLRALPVGAAPILVSSPLGERVTFADPVIQYATSAWCACRGSCAAARRTAG